jgi:hypothetical protein
MGLKSSKLIKAKKKKKKPFGNIITAGITALIGTALVAQTASAIRRI